MFKDKIIIWTPDLPEGNDIFDQDDVEEMPEDEKKILRNEFLKRLEENEKKDLS